ncbi:uncharacterized protein YALI1_C23723g [Yarrowia lipolytica]|uniref:Uncharacterized protein n=1 Tax=Yarrowia lipolytica TaxID=4952 RepID=A0A1D8NBG8_YARLL|nr:hypothetical protein YALI1_C23723g [Yarrowia lipolytica]
MSYTTYVHTYILVRLALMEVLVPSDRAMYSASAVDSAIDFSLLDRQHENQHTLIVLRWEDFSGPRINLE